MKKLMLQNLTLNENTLLSTEEKRSILGGGWVSPGCGDEPWIECPNKPMCVLELNECYM